MQRMSMGLPNKAGRVISILLGTWSAASAQTESEVAFYQATEVVTGIEMHERTMGMGKCLRDVLVKATGEPRLAKDPRVQALMTGADRYVAYYMYRDTMEGIHHHDDQGTHDRPYELTVQFDPPRVDVVLHDLGETLWKNVRPDVVPAIAVRGTDRPFLMKHMLSNDITSDDPIISNQRQSLGYIASKYGMRVRFPSEEDLTHWGVTADGFPTPQVQLSPKQVLVAGTMDFRLETFWVGTWRMQWRGNQYNWGISGVSYDRALENMLAGVMRVVSGHGTPD